MSAASIDYGSIRVSWKQPSGIMFRFRLLANRYGYPVNENDGTLIYDSVTYPGSSYLDQNVIPGTYHYYAFYVLVDIADNIWIRSGLAACLAVKNFSSSAQMLDLIPQCMKTIPATGGELTTDAAGNVYLQKFLDVLGWAMDYLRTQYDVLFKHLNDPLFIPLDDLWNMAAEVGLTFSTEIPAYAVRKAVLNWAHVSQERGTFLGINNEITLRTGWSADVQIGPNILLEDDQAQFLGNIILPYTPAKCYHIYECVWIPHWGIDFRFGWPGDGFWYQCLTEGLRGISPPNNGSSNGNWHCVKNQDDFLCDLTNPETTAPSTWEVLDSSAANGIPAPAATGPAITQALGVPNPTAPTTNYNAWNALRFYNRQGSAKTLWARSVARRHVDLGTLPDGGFESGFTVKSSAPVTRKSWVPRNWPLLFESGTDSNANDRDDFLVPAYWTQQNCDFDRSQAFAHTGIWSARLVSGGAGPDPGILSPWVEVPGGTAVTGSMYAYSPGALSQQVFASMQWYDQNGAPINSAFGTVVTLAAATWTNLTVSGTAPSNASYLSLNFFIESPSLVTDVVYLDDMSVVAGLALSPSWPVDQINAVSDGIPVPWVRPSQSWDPAATYATNDIVSYNGQPFTALKASSGVAPNTNNTANNEWAPLSQDQRIRLCISGYLSQDLSVGTNNTAQAIPFVEWFDQQGNFLARVFARNPNVGGGVTARPNLMAFDSFTTQSFISSGSSGGSSSLGIAAPGWTASYYANTTLSGTPVHTDVETGVNYNWAGSPPASGMPSSGWSASWIGTITAPRNGTYSFTIQSQGSSRLFVGGTQVINNWSSPVSSPVSGTIALTGGVTYTIEVDLSVAAVPAGGLGPNLLSSAGTVQSSLDSPYSLPSFPATPGAEFTFSDNYVAENVPGYGAGTPTDPASQISFYDSAHNPIATATGVSSISGTVPAGASTAIVTVSGESRHTSTGGTMQTHYGDLAWSAFSYQENVPGGVISDSLEVTSPFTYSWPGGGGTVYSVSSSLAGRTTDDEQSVWNVPDGGFTVGGFEGGSVWPANPSARSLALVTGPANTNLGITFRAPPLAGNSHGLVFRYSDDTDYWRAGSATLRKKVSGVWTTVATYSTPCAPNDRLQVVLNGSSITVYRNGNNQVASVTDAFNDTATRHGIVHEPT